eukprot:gene11418-17791_t
MILSCILVPFWLWLTRHTWSSSAFLGVLLFILGVLLFLAAEAITDRENDRLAALRLVTTHETSIPPPRPAFSSLVGGALKASQANSKGRGLPPPVVAGVAGVAGIAGNKADPALAKEVRQKLIKLESVRQKLIKLESVMFGNELTEGVLPLEVLHQRVLALCEDLGVQPKGSTNTMSLAHMSSLLDEVASHVGV